MCIKVFIWVSESLSCYVCCLIETVKRNEDKDKLDEAVAKLGEAQAKLGEARGKLSTIEQTCHEDEIKMAVLEAKLVAMEKTYQEDHEKHNLQIHAWAAEGEHTDTGWEEKADDEGGWAGARSTTAQQTSLLTCTSTRLVLPLDSHACIYLWQN